MTRHFRAIAVAAVFTFAGCSKATAPTPGPTRDLSNVQTDTTIYYATLQGSQWVVFGVVNWAVDYPLKSLLAADTLIAYEPCHPGSSDAAVAVERPDGNPAPVAFAQISDCTPDLLQSLRIDRSTQLYFTISAPASAPVAERTGLMRIRLKICSTATDCIPMAIAGSPVSNTFEVRQ
jgi:hypothetical protein